MKRRVAKIYIIIVNIKNNRTVNKYSNQNIFSNNKILKEIISNGNLNIKINKNIIHMKKNRPLSIANSNINTR